MFRTPLATKEFVVPAVIGNAIGGVLLVELLNYGQVAAEREDAPPGTRKADGEGLAGPGEVDPIGPRRRTREACINHSSLRLEEVQT